MKWLPKLNDLNLSAIGNPFVIASYQTHYTPNAITHALKPPIGPGMVNEPEPGKRPRSSISPTIVVEDGEPVLVVGGAGGSQIIMGVLHAIVNTVDYGMGIAHAVDAERLDAQFEPGEFILEDGRVSAVAESGLISRGHVVEPEGEYADVPLIQAAGIDPVTGERLAVTDPRSGEQASAGQGLSQGTVAPLPDTGGIPPSAGWLAPR